MVGASDKDLVCWIPGRVLLWANRDADLQQHLTDVVFRTGLFSAKLSTGNAARLLASVYMDSTPQVSRTDHCHHAFGMVRLSVSAQPFFATKLDVMQYVVGGKRSHQPL